MIRHICNVIEDLDLILKERMLRWYGHAERSNGAVKTAFDLQVDGKRGPGRHKMIWKQLTESDCREWKLSAIDPNDRHTWRTGVRSTLRAASQLPGRGPTDVDVVPVPARQSKFRLHYIIYYITLLSAYSAHLRFELNLKKNVCWTSFNF